MPIVSIHPAEFLHLIRERRAMGGDRYDEVWDGVYVMSPLADNEHQELGFDLAVAIKMALSPSEEVRIFPGCNVTDRPRGWKRNYRCPDVAVFLPGNPAKDHKTRWYGGPDFAVEVLSPQDRSREKFDFYAKVGVRELMLVARRPWALELYRHGDEGWSLAGKATEETTDLVLSAVLALNFRLIPGTRRPRIEVSKTDGSQHWLA